MFNLAHIQSVSGFVALLMAYFFSIIFVGFFQALFAKKMGDDTAEHFGFLSLQPNVYIDWVGMFCLLLIGFGWGRTVPIDRNNFHGRFGSFWFSCVYMFNIFAHFILAIIAMTSALALFGVSITVVLGNSLASVGQYSSYAIALGMILGKLLLLNISLCMIRIIFNVVDLIFVFHFNRPAEFIEYRDPYALVAILLICLFLGDRIVYVLYSLVAALSWLIAHYILHAL